MNNTTNKKELFHRSMQALKKNPEVRKAQSVYDSQHSDPFGSGRSVSDYYKDILQGNLNVPGITPSGKGGRVRKSRRVKKTKTRRHKKTKSRRPKKTKSRRVKKSKSRRR